MTRHIQPALRCREVALTGGKDADAQNAKRLLIILGKRAQALGLFTTLLETASDCFVIISLIM